MAGADWRSLPTSEIIHELEKGGRFIVYPYCISVLILTFRRHSDIRFVRAGQSAFAGAIPYILLSLVTGWWGIPWGPIYTVGALVTNFKGGKDVTAQIRLQAHV